MLASAIRHAHMLYVCLHVVLSWAAIIWRVVSDRARSSARSIAGPEPSKRRVAGLMPAVSAVCSVQELERGPLRFFAVTYCRNG